MREARGGGGRAALPLAACLLVLTGCTSSRDSAAPAPDRTAGVEVYAGEPTPGATTAAPALARPLPAGTVRLAAGPFNDRFVLRGLRWHKNGRPAVTGTLDVNSDVSELLALTVSASFYDARGRALGSTSYRMAPPAHEEAHPIGADLNRAPFRLTAPPAAARATAAVLSVPVLVNE